MLFHNVLYTFGDIYTESQTLQTDLLAPNTSKCYSVPQTVGRPAEIIWPGIRDGSDCLCVPSLEDNCLCESNYTVNISSNDSVCFYNLTPAMNGTLIHFRQHNDKVCNITNILSSYRIIIFGMYSKSHYCVII